MKVYHYLMEKREAFKMYLKLYDYSIYLDEETGTLFAFQKVKGEAGSQDLGSEKAIRDWWHFMAPLMIVNEDESPLSVPLEEMFHLD